ncbi:MAG: hypothetical protein JO028_06810 [Acidobacteriaceae bacterium]|nr:hypothetical protein [Acidobacteriaceae bacterium]
MAISRKVACGPLDAPAPGSHSPLGSQHASAMTILRLRDPPAELLDTGRDGTLFVIAIIRV